MFYEDFSNPKYLSDKCDWTFPHVQNFYLNNSQVFYESRKLLLEKPMITIPDLLLVVHSSKDTLESSSESNAKIIIHLSGKEDWNFSKLYRVRPIFVGKGPFDYYKIYGYDSPETLLYYSVEIRNYSTNSIKIYGL